jgi:CreA protein
MLLRLGIALVLLVLLIGTGWWLFGGGPRGEVGAVSTGFRWLGPNDKIVIDAFDDPKVDGIACHIARPERGGVKGAAGVAEEAAEASIACRQIGPIIVRDTLRDGEKVFDERRSLIFKSLQVVRFFDPKRNVLVYVAYTDRVMTGSPQNSISSVPLMPWGGVPPKLPATAAG